MAANRKDIPTIDSSELRELTDKLITACHILDHEGVTDGYGHVGVRVPGADAFVTIANISPGYVTRDRLIMQDFAGNHLDGALTGIGGAGYKEHTGFCVDTQHFPDSVYRASFPCVVLQRARCLTSPTACRVAVK